MRANMIAGNLQATIDIAIAWDSLEESEQTKLVEAWESIMDSSENMVSDIILVISNHSTLDPFWKGLSEEVHDSRRYIWERICLGDIKHPDGSITKQAEITGQGEQADGGNQIQR